MKLPEKWIFQSNVKITSCKQAIILILSTSHSSCSVAKFSEPCDWWLPYFPNTIKWHVFELRSPSSNDRQNWNISTIELSKKRRKWFVTHELNETFFDNVFESGAWSSTQLDLGFLRPLETGARSVLCPSDKQLIYNSYGFEAELA